MIDNKTIIDPSAKLGKNVSVGPWSIIGPNVEIGEGTIIEAHVNIKQDTKIGKHNHIYSFASVGDDPQHLGYKDQKVYLEIGDHNIIREFCTLNRGSMDGNGVTRIGNHNFIMAYCHIAHDCVVGNHIIFANNASIAGHVHVNDYVIMGAFAGVHQFCHIASYSFLGRACKIVKDIPPYMMIKGNPGGPCGLNGIGLKRHGFKLEQIRHIKEAYHLLYREGLKRKDAYQKLKKRAKKYPELQLFIDLMDHGTRGLARPS